MNHREFVDKQVIFSDGVSGKNNQGKLYVYYTQVPEGSPFEKDKPPKTDRAYTIIGVQKMERRPEDGKIVYSMLMQMDLKMNVTPKLIALFLPSGMQDWNQRINKFISNNYDKI